MSGAKYPLCMGPLVPDEERGNGGENHGSLAVVSRGDGMDCAHESVVHQTDPLVEGSLSSSPVTLRALGLVVVVTAHEGLYKNHIHRDEGTWRDLP